MEFLELLIKTMFQWFIGLAYIVLIAIVIGVINYLSTVLFGAEPKTMTQFLLSVGWVIVPLVVGGMFYNTDK